EQKYYDTELLHKSPPIYDGYITGSDQVWNPRNNNCDSSYFLTFAPDGKRRISYAASFGVAEIKHGVKKKYAEWLKKINHISVREFEGVRIVKKLIGTNAELVLDPTLLLDRDHWDQIAIPYKKADPYILCYYMPGDRLVNRSITRIAKNVAGMYGWKVINIGEKEYMRLNPFRRSIFTAGPAEFLGFFHNASFVITNSYHGTAFAITYRIPFLVPINQNLPPQKALSSRITSLLKALELDQRIIRLKECIPEKIDIEIDYAPIEEKIESYRKRSSNFISEALRN
ncbi:MAG: polysaccharide pyruvyl transferase family protein, partial [Desulfobacteraceae bacterium]